MINNFLLSFIKHYFTECFQFLSQALHEKHFKLVLTYTKNVREPWLSNEKVKGKEPKKFLIFVMFTLA